MFHQSVCAYHWKPIANNYTSSSSSSRRKRPAEDIDNYSDSGGCQHENANVHGVWMQLSPVEKGKRSNFFEGQMRDGTSRMRFVGFKAEHRKKLVDFSQSGNLTCRIERLQDKSFQAGTPNGGSAEKFDRNQHIKENVRRVK